MAVDRAYWHIWVRPRSSRSSLWMWLTSRSERNPQRSGVGNMGTTNERLTHRLDLDAHMGPRSLLVDEGTDSCATFSRSMISALAPTGQRS